MRTQRFAMLAALSLAAAAGGCTTLSTPALRHETGESLGMGMVRLTGRFESTRMFPSLPENSTAAGVAQEGEAFKGGFLGVGVSYGVTPRFDVQLGTFFTWGGAGWRFGTKTQFWKKGGWAAAFMLGFGRFSAKGTETYLTDRFPVDVVQTLSASNVDLSFPVSYRLSPQFAVYSGLTLYHSGVTGSSDFTAVSMHQNDLGINLGFKFNFGKFEPDLEMAFVRVYDPFVDEFRIIPYFGISAGIVF